MEYSSALMGSVAGLIVGSFCATLVIRWSRGESIITGRSHCDHCGIQVSLGSLVPVIGFVVLGGRCGACRARINWRHPFMELVCAIIGGGAFGLMPDMDGLAGAVFGWLLLTLALLDLDNFWLPDRLVVPMGIGGLFVALLGRPPDLPDRLLGTAGGFLSLSALGWSYRRFRGRAAIGGGDPKLFAAIGAWLGWRALPLELLLAASAGIIWCFVMVLRGRKVSRYDAMPLGTLMAVAAWPLWLAGPALLP